MCANICYNTFNTHVKCDFTAKKTTVVQTVLFFFGKVTYFQTVLYMRYPVLEKVYHKMPTETFMFWILNPGKIHDDPRFWWKLFESKGFNFEENCESRKQLPEFNNPYYCWLSFLFAVNTKRAMHSTQSLLIFAMDCNGDLIYLMVISWMLRTSAPPIRANYDRSNARLYAC